MVTQQQLKKLLHYDPETGKFTWLESKRGRRPLSRRVYSSLRIDGRQYLTHRLAWIYVNGDIPDGIEVDHINGDPADNRIANLRLATRAQNHANRRLSNTNKAGLKGVHTTKHGRCAARINHMGKRYWLGRFDTAEEAHAAYVSAAKRLHGEFARAA